MNKYITFNKFILHTVDAYMTKAKEEGLTHDPMHLKLISGIRSFQMMGRFNAKEAKFIVDLGDHEEVKRMKQSDISFIIYALELMRLWVENVPFQNRKNIYLGVSNKKLKLGRAAYAVYMLKIKQSDEAKYKELKSIIDDSVIAAKTYFSWFENKLVTD